MNSHTHNQHTHLTSKQKFQLMRDKISELERQVPTTLFINRLDLPDRMSQAFNTMIHEKKINAWIPMFQYYFTRGLPIIISLFLLVMFDKVTMSNIGMLFFGSYVYITVMYFFTKSYEQVRRKSLFLESMNDILAAVKEETKKDLENYEKKLFGKFKDADPLKELTKEVDPKYGYMSPEQIIAYWQEVELPLRQKGKEKWGDELAYIRKEHALLEEIEIILNPK